MFDLSNYEPVEKRIDRFYGQYSNGRIITELVAYSDQHFIVKASVYRDASDEKPAATGYAEERVGSNPVNRQFALENCESSAIGRSLANLNFAPKGARPSLEEMTKPERTGEEMPVTEYRPPAIKLNGPLARTDATEKQVNYLKKLIKETAADMQLDENHVLEFAWKDMGCTGTTETPSRSSASVLINDLTQDQISNSLFRQKLRDDRGEKPDPWDSPNF